MTIKLPYKVGKAVEYLAKVYSEDKLYHLEWILSNFNNSKLEDVNLQEAINNIVTYIKSNESNRKMYFIALVEGFEINEPTYWGEYILEDKENYFNLLVERLRDVFFSDKTHSIQVEYHNHPPEHFHSGIGNSIGFMIKPSVIDRIEIKIN